MVRLLNDNTIKKMAFLLKAYFKAHAPITHCVEVNNQQLTPCVYAVWHGNQFGIYGLQNKGKVNIMISKSLDGEIVAQGTEMLGFKNVRGSSGRQGSVSATKQLIERLLAGECAVLMVDGPRGPAGKVKGGIVKIARAANAPIVPMTWYSPQINFVKLRSWDKMTLPVGPVKAVCLYGDPIYAGDDEEQVVIGKIQASLDDIQKRAPEVYKQARKDKLWQNTVK
ncbi:MAG: DUF374 domain-containing protein [Heliobacteriaceae bacterium]|jgi:lysophospholipid acyltransferase (LPLAT)-like uncharacterized protein|nr:DUF374 domain-containing protein [Heliobacteriaceae bacterium]